MKPLAIGRGTGRMLDKRGYVLALAKGHPRANRDGYVWEHVLVAEKSLGRFIPPDHPIHHVDGNPANNEPSNLVVCEDQAFHRLLHQRTDALQACGDANALKCNICGSYDRQDEIQEYSHRGVGRCGRHASCNRVHVRLATRAKKRPLAIDLFCGLSGWGEGLIAEGFDVVGYDIEDMFAALGRPKPEHFLLALRDVATLNGAQFRNADLIVASPPCQEYSWMAMPWSRAKQVASALRGVGDFPDNYKGSRTTEQLTALFNACFRIQREACEAAGRHIPMVVENVRGAQPWVGRAQWNYGSFYLWGDVPALMPPSLKVFKVPGQKHIRDGHSHTRHLTNPAEHLAIAETGTKIGGDWFSDPQSTCRRHGSKSKARKAASAMIAKIPLPLSRHVASTFRPDPLREAA